MFSTSEIMLQEIAEAAVAQPIGVRFAVSSIPEARRSFYSMRAKCRKVGVDTYDSLGLYVSPRTPLEMWMLREALPGVGAGSKPLTMDNLLTAKDLL